MTIRILYPKGNVIELRNPVGIMHHTKLYYLRRLHRYMGVTIGIQFLLWTVGGLYFSWSDMDEIHGDYQRRPAPLLVSRSSCDLSL